MQGLLFPNPRHIWPVFLSFSLQLGLFPFARNDTSVIARRRREILHCVQDRLRNLNASLLRFARNDVIARNDVVARNDTSVIPAFVIPAFVIPTFVIPTSVIPAFVIPAFVIPAFVIPAFVIPAK